MIRYLLRRIVYGFLILLGVNLLTFLIFFAVNTPDDMARIAIGGKYVSAEAIADWHGKSDEDDFLGTICAAAPDGFRNERPGPQHQ